VRLDEDDVDSASAYRFKMSKWSQTTYTAVSDRCFWFLMFICNEVRSSLSHFYASMLKAAAASQTSGGVLFSFVTRIVPTTLAEMAAFTAGLEPWWNKAVESYGSGLPEAALSILKSAAASLTATESAGFDRRIANLARTFTPFARNRRFVAVVFVFDSFLNPQS
jgi:hypothetical protein